MIEGETIRKRVSEESTDRPLRAAVYARTSSKNQEYGYSLDEQVSRCLDRCESLGWEVVFLYRDEAESGKNTDRPMFKKMLDAADREAFDVIVFWKLDRFSRSLMHAVRLESELREHDIYLYSITEQIDTTSSTGRFNFRNLASAAEFERDMIQQRTKMGLNALASEHKWPNDNTPLGFELDADRRLAVVPEERDLVVEIFELYIEERSMPSVAEILNQRGFRTSGGEEWTARSVSDILRNEIYFGRYEVGDVSEYVSDYQLIDKDTYEKVERIRRRFRKDDHLRPSMPDDQKNKFIERIHEMYVEFVEGTDTV